MYLDTNDTNKLFVERHRYRFHVMSNVLSPVLLGLFAKRLRRLTAIFL